MIAMLLSVVWSVVLALLIVEIRFRMGHLSRLLLRIAARRLPRPYGERLLEEWTRHVRDLCSDAPISALVYAISRFRETRAIREVLIPNRYERSVAARRAKRSIDISVAYIALVFWAPLLAVLAIATRLSSPGPVLYRRRRIGLDGREFDMLAFRTLRVAPPASADPMHGILCDRRTRVGMLMRRLSLDELPQLINVLRGDMALVGPRPERTSFVWSRDQNGVRGGPHGMKSGLTGWAQVQGLVGLSSLADRVEWDAYYVENWSLWLDVKIMLMTIPALLSRSQAE